jgi:hypothetical protein
LAEIQLCKIKAEEYLDADHAPGNEKLILFSSRTKGIELVNKSEILADGKMYDIVKTRITDGVIFYYTVSDKDEDEDVQNLENLEKNNPGEKSLPLKIVKLYDQKYFDAKNNYPSICLSLDLLPDLTSVNESFFYRVFFKDIFGPPPDHLFS